MARSRNIKPAFFTDDKLGDLEPIVRLVFIGMWTIADFRGCIEYRPKMMKVQLIPYDNHDITNIVNILEQARLIRMYSGGEKNYIKIVNFERHQNPHKNEREAGSSIPDYDESTIENNELSKDGTKPDKIGTARADSLLLIPDSFNPLTDSSGKSASCDFDEFWKFYPNKTGKQAALKSWKKEKPDIDSVLKTLSWQVDTEQWKKDGGKFIPNPSTYLNQHRWEDEPCMVKRELTFAEQVFGEKYGTERQIKTINPRSAIESIGTSIPEAIAYVRESDES